MQECYCVPLGLVVVCSISPDLNDVEVVLVLRQHTQPRESSHHPQRPATATKAKQRLAGLPVEPSSQNLKQKSQRPILNREWHKADFWRTAQCLI